MISTIVMAGTTTFFPNRLPQLGNPFKFVRGSWVYVYPQKMFSRKVTRARLPMS